MDKNKQIAVIAVVAIVVIAAIGVGIFLNNNSDKGKTYNIAVVKHNFEPLFIAEELGYFDDAGVKVNLVSVDSGGLSSTALSSGKVDLAGFGSDPFLKLIDSYGDQYKYIGRWMLDEGLKGATASTNSYAFDGSSLIGAKIGVNTSVSYYSLLLKYLDMTDQEFVLQTNKDVVDSSKVNIYNYANTALGLALTSGEVDMIIAGAGNIAVVETNGGAYKYVEATEEYVSLMSVGLFANKDTIANNSADLKKILSAIDKACKYMNDPNTQEDAVEICMDKLDINNKTIMTKYITLAQWGVDLNEDDSSSIESSFQYIVKSSPSKYTGHLKGLEEIDITPYFDKTCLA